MSSSGSRWRLVVVDMDGTLVPGTSALAHLSSRLGHEPLIDGLEHQLAQGLVTDRDVAETYARSYRGVALADAAQQMSRIPLLDDISTGVELLRGRSVDAVIVTVSWSFAAQALADLWGFTHAYGADLELDSTTGHFTGTVARHFRPQDKALVVEQHCQRAGISMEQVVAIGDSRSDLPLFQAVGFSVALNATDDARAAATISVDSLSLLTALRAVPGLTADRTDWRRPAAVVRRCFLQSAAKVLHRQEQRPALPAPTARPGRPRPPGSAPGPRQGRRSR